MEGSATELRSVTKPADDEYLNGSSWARPILATYGTRSLTINSLLHSLVSENA